MRTLLFFALFIALNSAALADGYLERSSLPSNTILISDIDDTIRISQILSRNDHHLNTAVNYTSSDLAFDGMAETYQELAKQGMGFAFVSSIPNPIRFLAQRFLTKAGFPPGTLWARSGSDRRNHKLNSIRAIMSQNPGKHFILVGDNGESDPEVYRQIMEDPDLGPRVIGVFIHELYDHGSVPNRQTPFLTNGDFAAWLYKKNLLTQEYAAKSIHQAVARLEPLSTAKGLKPSTRDLAQGHRAYPFFAEASETRVTEVLSTLRQQAAGSLIPGLERLETLLVGRARSKKFLGCVQNFVLRVAK